MHLRNVRRYLRTNADYFMDDDKILDRAYFIGVPLATEPHMLCFTHNEYYKKALKLVYNSDRSLSLTGHGQICPNKWSSNAVRSSKHCHKIWATLRVQWNWWHCSANRSMLGWFDWFPLSAMDKLRHPNTTNKGPFKSIYTLSAWNDSLEIYSSVTIAIYSIISNFLTHIHT